MRKNTANFGVEKNTGYKFPRPAKLPDDYEANKQLVK
jgi:hypothetical protein